MSHVLIAEDSATQATVLKLMLQNAGYQVSNFPDGVQALAAIERSLPDAVLTDLMMPNMNGLELVETIRAQFPMVPTILMTAAGTEDIAAEAIQKGAVSYIPKRRLDSDLLRTLASVLGLSRADRRHQLLLECWSSNNSTFILDNNPSLVPLLVTHLQDDLSLMNLCEPANALRIGIALTETLDNAIFHGNLELESKLREGDGSAWNETARDRRAMAPYRDRRVYVTTQLSRSEAIFSIRDEGPGFDTTRLPDPTDPSQLENISGRGLFLIRTFMDDVRFNSTGNEITLVKKRETKPLGDET